MSRSDLPARLLPALRNCAGLRLCVAYSGGLDSSVLLHLLARLVPEAGFLLSAVHVHHGLSVQAEAWARHCGEQCARLGVPLHIERVQVARDAGKGLEAAARAARRAVFAAQEADWIVLAHHADDQAETLLHRLMRGTGVLGAGAMRERDPALRLWRPLLGESRADLLAWAQAEGLCWVEDDSNPDPRFTRNYLRHVVLAPLAQRLPAAPRNLARAAGHFAEAANLLAELAELDASEVQLGAEGSRERLRALSPERGRNLLRHWLAGGDELLPEAARLAACQLRLNGDAPVREELCGVALCAYRSRVWLEPVAEPCFSGQVWDGADELAWSGGALRCTSGGLGEALVLRSRTGGERLRLAANRPTRTLRQLCQEVGLPPWWRASLPLLWRGNELVWAAGIGWAAGQGRARIEWCGPDGLWR